MKDSHCLERWYDKKSKMTELLVVLQTLTKESRIEIANSFTEFVNFMRDSKEINEEKVISIGKQRVLGLYKASNKSRWYDNDESTRKIMTLISTFEEEDVELIIEGFLQTLKNSVEP